MKGKSVKEKSQSKPRGKKPQGGPVKESSRPQPAQRLPVVEKVKARPVAEEGPKGSSRARSGVRLTLGFMCERLLEEWTASMWAGVCDAALEHEANLFCFSGSTLYDPRLFNNQANLVYDLADAQNLDGLVLWGAQLAYHTTIEELKVFCERYRPLPIVNIGLALEGIPSLLVDNYQGMHDVVAHLIAVHGYRRIAYIGGPSDTPEARDRWRGYADALAEHGIALDPTLVVTGSDMEELYRQNVDSGEIGVHVLLDERKLRPRMDFEAVVGVNDGTCWFALKALQARGIRVPADVAMVGFDDLQESRYQTPPLTTVRQSFYDLGWRGVEMLLAQLRGEEVAEQVVLPMEVMVRQSCGCEDPAVVAARECSGGVARRKRLRAALGGAREQVVAEMARAVGDSEEVLGQARQVLDGFVAEVEGEEGAFLGALGEVLQQAMAVDGAALTGFGQDVAVWQGALSALRRGLLPYLGSEVLTHAESLWQQARVLVGETARREQAYRALQAERRARTLREIGAALLTTFDWEARAPTCA